MSDNFDVATIGSEYKYGFIDEVKPVFKSEKGLSRRVVEAISYHKGEPQWMLDFRLKALEIFESKPMPTWGGDLSGLNFDEIYFYAKPTEVRDAKSWDEVPEEIRRTYERLGIPEAERKVLAGVGAQYDSEMVYHQVREELARLGVIFVSIEEGLKHYEDLFREYFATVIPPEDNKFAALNSAVWSGGSFVYVPKGVKVELPLQAYFRVNTAELGQFERTLIIVDEGAEMHYIEGCTAPTYSTDSFHSGVIEIVVNKGARSRYTTIQNWSHNMYNLVTQRAMVYGDAYHEWLDGNLGSKLTMKYPSSYLMEPGARSEIMSIAFANTGQHQDTGGKLILAAPHTSGTIVSKSISKGEGRASYRGLVKVYEGAKHARVNVECDALLINPESRTDTYPYIEIEEDTAHVGHEATVSKLNDEQIFYLQSRGLKEDEAAALIVRGFIEPIAKELPLEYAVELNRLIELEMEGSVG
ncbi:MULTISPECIES: Fe-S cluster assembly protein SufB [unclassified Meiothermus]|uniref:Fe-S cluster assembly protein SufB n=1 Tax=unclassified Meiothermus TaxID=370471 RepID=UPI000D7D1116|nr:MULTISPECIES: Fe-S cluster assembly protein SufB [unclassified Meiothermus]PZA07224.1 Fe-S cluster assembly protein SufB [Meiothermus sp. Pnk-1]RYM37958.1 Fe-S cluster assembly protein SufB [Meiothermus sp. PNK-Is4]